MKTLISEIIGMPKGASFTSFFCITGRTPPKSYLQGTKFKFDLDLTDKSGVIKLTYWGGANEANVKTVYDSISDDGVLFVSGTVGDFNGKKIDVNEGSGELRMAATTEYELADFMVASNQNIETLWNEIVSIKDSLENVHLKALLNAFCDDATFVDSFKKAPAAIIVHHACVGGLLEHTWEVLRYCKAAVDVHPSLDKSLLYTGAILHDIGKIKAYNVSMTIKESKEGMLTDHIFIATEQILDKISTIPEFPDLLKDKLIHMILSHHGKKEFGAAVEPKIPEAAALFCADMMGSHITQYIRIKKDSGETEDFRSNWNKYIGCSVFLK